jgi:hypothetical protein
VSPRKSLADLMPAAAPAIVPPPIERPAVNDLPAEPEADDPEAEPIVAPSEPAAPARRQSPKQPLYLQMERKETRIRTTQYDQLTTLSRRLNRKKPRGEGAPKERITENTLIRVAIDLLLAQQGRLSGATEEELRQSVSP